MGVEFSRNLELDRLRAIAILIVLYAHFCIIFWPRGTVLRLMAGTNMLDLSFTISGFVISSILVQSIDEMKTRTKDLILFLKAFYIRRILRIYPPAFAVFIACLIGSFIFADDFFSTPGNTLLTGLLIITYVFNYFFLKLYHGLALAPYWTLVIEEQFYLLFPLFLVLTRNNAQRIRISIAMLIIITLIIRPVTLHYYKGPAIFFSQVRFDGFFYGYLIYCLMAQPWAKAVNVDTVSRKWVRSVDIVSVFYTMIIITVLNFSPSILLPIGMLVCALLVFLAAFRANIIIFPFIIQRIIDFLGTRFYSLYLVHVPAMILVKLLWIHLKVADQNQTLYSLLAAPPAVLIAMELLYRLFEVPGKQYGRQISKSLLSDKQANVSLVLKDSHPTSAH